MYTMNPEGLYRLVQLEHEHRIKQADRVSRFVRERER